jgi:hypothetical protein
MHYSMPGRMTWVVYFELSEGQSNGSSRIMHIGHVA